MNIKAVVFDIGNVLIGWDPEGFYDRVIGPDRRQALFDAVDLSGMNEAIDLGAPFQKTIYERAVQTPEWEAEIRLWHDRWIEMASPAIDRSVRLMTALQARGLPVFSLSNFGADSYRVAAQYYPFLNEFDRDFVSGHLEVIKPDPEIYRILETQTGLSGDELIFTDDRPENIAAARNFGWQTHLFEGPAGWAARLVSEGLLTESEAT